MNSNVLYTMSDVARAMGNDKIGRTKIYIILRVTGIIDEANHPIQKHIDYGSLAVGVSHYRYTGLKKHVTLARGNEGVYFIIGVVKKYLRDHPVPKVQRKPRIRYTVDI